MPFWKDRVALMTSLLGLCLAVPTVLWRVNPVEGGVMPSFVTQTVPGQALFFVLLVSSVPTWFADLPLAMVLPTSWGPVGFVVAQGLVYLLIGKALSSLRRRFRKQRSAVAPE